MEISCIDAFPTPILIQQWDNSGPLNKALHQIIIELANSTPGLQNSNVGGYHSDTQFIHKSIAPIQELKGRILQLSKRMGMCYGLTEDTTLEAALAGWANLMTHGNYHRLHGHPDYHWSGVYYVSTGTLIPNKKPNGNLQFQDPRPGAKRLTVAGLELSPSFSIIPAPGLMVMFPSYLEHYVHPFFGEGERISIAFNIKVTRVNSPEQGTSPRDTTNPPKEVRPWISFS